MLVEVVLRVSAMVLAFNERSFDAIEVSNRVADQTRQFLRLRSVIVDQLSVAIRFFNHLL